MDSLSTLWLADMPSRFARARAWVAEMDFSRLRGCNLFESNIRILGGLLSAGALSGDAMFYESERPPRAASRPAGNTRPLTPVQRPNRLPSR